jgi:hypothetical protein
MTMAEIPPIYREALGDTRWIGSVDRKVWTGWQLVTEVHVPWEVMVRTIELPVADGQAHMLKHPATGREWRRIR